MKVELEFAHLHTPLFLKGTNWGEKLKTGHNLKGDLVLAYDREHGELLVSCGTHIAIIPSSNVSSMTPKAETKAAPAPAPQVEKQKPGPKPGKITAQVSGPTHHVFAEGPGKSRD